MAEKTYRVVGDRAVHGAEPGQTFTADITDEQEQALIDGGHIQVSTAKKPDVKASAAPAVEEGGTP